MARIAAIQRRLVAVRSSLRHCLASVTLGISAVALWRRRVAVAVVPVVFVVALGHHCSSDQRRLFGRLAGVLRQRIVAVVLVGVTLDKITGTRRDDHLIGGVKIFVHRRGDNPHGDCHSDQQSENRDSSSDAPAHVSFRT